MKMLKIKPTTIANTIAVVFFVLLCWFVAYKIYQAMFNHFLNKEVASRSQCISDELKTDYLSTDLMNCLCGEWGGTAQAFELEPGVQVNACVFNKGNYGQ